MFSLWPNLTKYLSGSVPIKPLPKKCPKSGVVHQCVYFFNLCFFSEAKLLIYFISPMPSTFQPSFILLFAIFIYLLLSLSPPPSISIIMTIMDRIFEFLNGIHVEKQRSQFKMEVRCCCPNMHWHNDNVQVTFFKTLFGF